MLHTIPLLVSSDYKNGATVSTDGSQFNVHMEGGLGIPKEAQNVSLTVESSTVWWVVPNILAATDSSTPNNKLYITGDNNQNANASFTIEIPTGLYDVAQLNQQVEVLLENAGARTDPDPLLTFTGNLSTGKVDTRFNYSNVTVNYTHGDTPREVLGYDNLTYNPGQVQTVPAPFEAKFNTIEYFVLRSDMVDKGIREGNSYRQAIAFVNINNSPGNQLVSEPNHPPTVPCQNLAGSLKNDFTFTLTDHLNNRVKMTETFSIRMTISYYL